jgi:DNA mismatch endonuclease (patch repair protein)
MHKKLKVKLKGGKFEGVPPERSRIMSAIRGKGNRTTELRFRLALVRKGIKGWKIHPRNVPGNPDFFFPGINLAIFLDGCFWHGCPVCGHVPRTNRLYWEEKIRRNKERDHEVAIRLQLDGIRVLRIWEHQLREGKLEKTLADVASAQCRA